MHQNIFLYAQHTLVFCGTFYNTYFNKRTLNIEVPCRNTSSLIASNGKYMELTKLLMCITQQPADRSRFHMSFTFVGENDYHILTFCWTST